MYFQIEKLPFYNVKRYLGYCKLKIFLGRKNICLHEKNNKKFDYIVANRKKFYEKMLNFINDVKFYCNNQLQCKGNLNKKIYFNIDEFKDYCLEGKLSTTVYFENSHDSLVVCDTFVCVENTGKIRFIEKYAYEKNYYADYIKLVEKQLKKNFHKK